MISIRLLRLYRRLSYLTGLSRDFRPGMQGLPPPFQTGPHGINPHHTLPEDYVSKARTITPVPFDTFDPERNCPSWVAFLDQALGAHRPACRPLRRRPH